MYKIIQEIESDNSRLFKESVLRREAEAGNDILFLGLRTCYDPMITFGIKKVPESKSSGPGLSWEEFRDVAHALAQRELTGDAARDAVDELIKQATQDEWNGWYRRILIKDMRAGFSEKTINTVVKKINDSYLIPLFECQLAHDSANHEGKVTGKKYIEVKLDGVRVITIVQPNGRVDMYSRNGKELANFPHIAEQISKVAGQFAEPTVLDGEVMSSSFQDLMKQVHRKSDVQSNDAVLHLFDILTLEEFKAGKSLVNQEKRSETVYKWHKANKDVLPNVAVVGHELVDLGTDEGQKRYREINAHAIEGGYEGIMLKDPDAPYECKRSVSWLKLKPFIEVTLTVTGIEEGTGRNVGKLGAIICEGVDDGKRIRVNVGSGFSDVQRDDIWLDQAAVVGSLVEVRADAATRSQDSEDVWSLRFPRFLRFRGFEKGEKI